MARTYLAKNNEHNHYYNSPWATSMYWHSLTALPLGVRFVLGKQNILIKRRTFHFPGTNPVGYALHVCHVCIQCSVFILFNFCFSLLSCSSGVLAPRFLGELFNDLRSSLYDTLEATARYFLRLFKSFSNTLSRCFESQLLLFHSIESKIGLDSKGPSSFVLKNL